MSSLLVILVSLMFVSCSSFQNANTGDQHGRQMDERSLKAGFMGR